MTDAVVPFTGWGRGTWDELAFGEGSITNAGASGQVGSVTVVAEANVEGRRALLAASRLLRKPMLM